MWCIPRSTFYAQKNHSGTFQDKRGRRPRVSDDELLALIKQELKHIEELGFHGEGYRKIWARLKMKGTSVNKERIRLLMKRHGLLAPMRTGRARGPRTHDGTIIPIGPNLMWGTDATATYTKTDDNVTVFAAVDHFTGECVGIHAAIKGNRFEALEPLRQGVLMHYKKYDAKVAKGLLVRHDHGSQYMSGDFQRELKFLGIESSPSFVRCPEGNGVIERFFRTLKEQLLWCRCFNSIGELLEALHEFRDKFNHHWIMQRHAYKTPSQVRSEWESGRLMGLLSGCSNN